MKGIFAWYVYAMLALMLVGAGVSNSIRGNTVTGGGYVIAGLFLFGFAVMSGRKNKGSQTSGIEAKTQALLPVLKALLAEGKKEDAIRRVRVLTGSDLNEAKDLIDQLAIEQAEAMAQMDYQLKRLRSQKSRVEAIRYYREVTGADLKLAQAYVASIDEKISDGNGKP